MSRAVILTRTARVRASVAPHHSLRRQRTMPNTISDMETISLWPLPGPCIKMSGFQAKKTRGANDVCSGPALVPPGAANQPMRMAHIRYASRTTSLRLIDPGTISVAPRRSGTCTSISHSGP